MQKVVSTIDELNFFTVIGTVEGASTWSETSFSTTTRPGFTDSTGYTTSGYTTTSTSTTERNRFFVKRTEDGKEYEVDLYGNKFSVREGHEVGIFYVGRTDDDLCYPLLYENYSTDKRWMRRSNFDSARGTAVKAGCLSVTTITLGALGLMFALAALSEGHELGPLLGVLGAGLLGLGIFLTLRASASGNQARAIDARIIEIGKRNLENRTSVLKKTPLSAG
ncbi:hypothetical protein [Pontixanthobacter aquaemixtae]|uniref:Uncharacterized protein n=1 Tax=Pontixanthobacter aquaemixtae TaxID=1958940 RepID=A0A844ZXZ7_9SPHN|nr:hypothetical protein [Pontixanthobacter aquaemixtae]MXO90359.1 hypothetical protein [Pontixanthobacter aquaemixtae]